MRREHNDDDNNGGGKHTHGEGAVSPCTPDCMFGVVLTTRSVLRSVPHHTSNYTILFRCHNIYHHLMFCTEERALVRSWPDCGCGFARRTSVLADWRVLLWLRKRARAEGTHMHGACTGDFLPTVIQTLHFASPSIILLVGLRSRARAFVCERILFLTPEVPNREGWH